LENGDGIGEIPPWRGLLRLLGLNEGSEMTELGHRMGGYDQTPREVFIGILKATGFGAFG
jgi:hypothetical protein